MKKLRLCAAAVAALSAVTVARAQSDQPILGASRSNWPTELTRRPLVLDRGMIEVYAPLTFDISKGADGKPVTLAPSVYFGVSDRWMLGVRHQAGICFGSESDGCAETYNDVSVDSVLSLGRAGGLELALGVALNLAPIDPALWSGEGRLIARAGGGAFAITVAPTINFGLNDRDDESQVKSAPTTFNLGTYNTIRSVPTLGNREVVSIPATLQLQLGAALALVGGVAVEGPINPEDGDFGDFYRIPVSASVVLTPIPWIDLGATLIFPDLLGKNDSADFRAIGVFAAFRI